jgi:hypothetical protein
MVVQERRGYTHIATDPGYELAILVSAATPISALTVDLRFSTGIYTATMAIQFILPKKFTRSQIEWRLDELSLQFQCTRDRKIIAQISALSRLLAKMDARVSDPSQGKNRSSLRA